MNDILLVDDNVQNLRVLSDILSDLGYCVRSAQDGLMALVAIKAQIPNLILLDIMMPEMDGYEVCRQLKANTQTCDIPVIFMSALDATEDKVRAFAAGGVDYVTKPFQSQEVLARVQTHLALRDLQQKLQAANFQLAAQVEELQMRNAELDTFAHTVAHDLKCPVGFILGMSKVVVRNYGAVPPKEELECLNAITQMAVKTNDIIEALLLLTGVRKTEVQIIPLDMASIVNGAVARLSGQAKERQTEIVLPDAWPVALGYTPWVEEVWVNYVSNAIKYGGQPPRVEMGWDEGGRQNSEFIRFWVRDNGPGLAAEQQARLFTPFLRLHKERAEGHGLGLSIVQRIVEKLGGQVGIESKPGQGSIFWFRLAKA